MEDTNENRVAHLQMIQEVINRLANNSSLIKGWSVTVVAALFTVGVFGERSEILLAAFATTGFFWVLDAYYLRQERLFRNLYSSVHTAKPSTLAQPFGMDTNSLKSNSNHYIKVLLRPPLSIFYAAILLAAGVVAILISL